MLDDEKYFKPIMLVGVAIGIISGFFWFGLGGALLGAVLGPLVAFMVVGFVTEALPQMILVGILIAVPVGLLYAIVALWGVGN